jgi:hypothetical protein
MEGTRKSEKIRIEDEVKSKKGVAESPLNFGTTQFFTMLLVVKYKKKSYLISS